MTLREALQPPHRQFATACHRSRSNRSSSSTLVELSLLLDPAGNHCPRLRVPRRWKRSLASSPRLTWGRSSVPEQSKVTPFHLKRQAIVYVRQSTTSQVENNQESTQRQYALTARAGELGWTRDQITVIDEDLGLSGSGSADRAGFARLTAEVALGHVGVVLGLEVSRLARNNADWYRLLDLCGVTDTLIGDADGLYHPASFNDRLVLGLKGTMSEAELHVLRARLNGGIRNKAERGELRRGLPVGFAWGEGDGEILLDPDEAVVNAVRNVFQRFLEFGSARKT